jgi:hypothetical protein
MSKRTQILPALLAGFAISCASGDANVARGKGLAVATLPPVAQERIYEAAVHGAFEPDPSLSLLLDARQLPRKSGLLPDGSIPDAVAAELQQRGITRGTCSPPLGVIGVPRCTAARPGYVVRFSPVFSIRPDSVQVYIYVQKYDTPGGEPSQTLRFERAYQVIGHDDQWRAVLEARIPKD